jgi:hypothetical protein
MTGVRGQFNGLFRAMSEGGKWHLYRAPGTDHFAVLREDSQRDVPMDVAVANVHAMTVETLLARVTALLRT